MVMTGFATGTALDGVEGTAVGWMQGRVVAAGGHCLPEQVTKQLPVYSIRSNFHCKLLLTVGEEGKGFLVCCTNGYCLSAQGLTAASCSTNQSPMLSNWNEGQMMYACQVRKAVRGQVAFVSSFLLLAMV